MKRIPVRCTWAVPALAAACAAPIFAQTEAHLREAFEGAEAVVRIEMPASKEGVDVYPEVSRPVDFAQVGRRLRQYGVALRRGDVTSVTKVDVDDRKIEFHVGGGGYGTWGDRLREDAPETVVSVPKSREEKRLEDEYKSTRDPRAKEKLDDLRDERRREEARLEAAASTAEVIRDGQIRELALTAGSRFTLRFPGGVPTAALTPAGLAEMLRPYVELPQFAVVSQPIASSPAAVAPALLRKGMSEDEVASLYGAPLTRTIEGAGDFEGVRAVYQAADALLTVHYVSGVVVAYQMESN